MVLSISFFPHSSSSSEEENSPVRKFNPRETKNTSSLKLPLSDGYHWRWNPERHENPNHHDFRRTAGEVASADHGKDSIIRSSSSHHAVFYSFVIVVVVWFESNQTTTTTAAATTTEGPTTGTTVSSVSKGVADTGPVRLVRSYRQCLFHGSLQRHLQGAPQVVQCHHCL